MRRASGSAERPLGGSSRRSRWSQWSRHGYSVAKLGKQARLDSAAGRGGSAHTGLDTGGVAGGQLGCVSWAWCWWQASRASGLHSGVWSGLVWQRPGWFVPAGPAVKIQKRRCRCMQPPGTCTDVYNHRTSIVSGPSKPLSAPQPGITAFHARNTALRPSSRGFVCSTRSQSLLTRRRPPVAIGRTCDRPSPPPQPSLHSLRTCQDASFSAQPSLAPISSLRTVDVVSWPPIFPSRRASMWQSALAIRVCFVFPCALFHV